MRRELGSHYYRNGTALSELIDSWMSTIGSPGCHTLGRILCQDDPDTTFPVPVRGGAGCVHRVTLSEAKGT